MEHDERLVVHRDDTLHLVREVLTLVLLVLAIYAGLVYVEALPALGWAD